MKIPKTYKKVQGQKQFTPTIEELICNKQTQKNKETPDFQEAQNNDDEFQTLEPNNEYSNEIYNIDENIEEPQVENFQNNNNNLYFNSNHSNNNINSTTNDNNNNPSNDFSNENYNNNEIIPQLDYENGNPYRNTNPTFNNNTTDFANISPIAQQIMLEDENIWNLHQKLVQAKQQRKMCEKGVEVLNSRVRCLREENARTLAKINRTQKKVTERELQIERSRSKSKEKSLLKQKKEQDLKKQKMKNYEQKIQRENGIANEKEKTILRKQMQQKILKEEKQNNEIFRKSVNFQDQRDKKEKADFIRSRVNMTGNHRKLIEIENKAKIIQELENYIQIELNKKQEIDNEVNKLAIAENNLIEQINDVNLMQKKLVEDFDKFLYGFYSDNINFNS